MLVPWLWRLGLEPDTMLWWSGRGKTLSSGRVFREGKPPSEPMLCHISFQAAKERRCGWRNGAPVRAELAGRNELSLSSHRTLKQRAQARGGGRPGTNRNQGIVTNIRVRSGTQEEEKYQWNIPCHTAPHPAPRPAGWVGKRQQVGR